jgi:hypothetical protein
VWVISSPHIDIIYKVKRRSPFSSSPTTIGELTEIQGSFKDTAVSLCCEGLPQFFRYWSCVQIPSYLYLRACTSHSTQHLRHLPHHAISFEGMPSVMLPTTVAIAPTRPQSSGQTETPRLLRRNAYFLFPAVPSCPVQSHLPTCTLQKVGLPHWCPPIVLI